MKIQTGEIVIMDVKKRAKEEFSDVETVRELVIIRLNVPLF